VEASACLEYNRAENAGRMATKCSMNNGLFIELQKVIGFAQS
jgi:hypothetical protein